MPRTTHNAKPARTRFLSHALADTLRRNMPYALLIVCAVVAGAVFTVWPASVLRSLVDGPLTTGAPGLWQYAFRYLGAVLLIGLSDLLREIGATVFAQRMLLNLRKRMLDRLRRLPMAYYLGVPAGDTITRFTADIDAVNTLFSSGVISAAADLLKIGGVILALYALAPALGGIALGAMPVVYLLADIFRRKIYQKQKTVRKKVSDINSGIQEIYTGVRIIKIFGRERRFAARFEPLLEEHRLAMNANSRYDAWFPCVMQVVRAVAIAAIIVVGGGFNGTPVALGLSIGTLAAAADLMTRLFDPIEAVATELQTIQQAMAGLSRIDEFFAIETEPALSENAAETSPAGDAEVLVENVRFAYPTGGDVLHDTTLRVPAGAKAAIAGRTGSGKTTLMHLVAGLYAPGEGRITIAGQDPYRLPPAARRRLVGVVPQTVTVFNGTLMENVTLRDGSLTREQVARALETVGLSDTVGRLPQGMDTRIGEGEAGLSYGETQLLSLARAIVTDPPLLLLDEMTAGLDTVTERRVLQAVRAISENRTILTISHRLSGIVDADTVHIMERGRIVESGTPEELSRREGWFSIYRRLEDRGWKVS